MAITVGFQHVSPCFNHPKLVLSRISQRPIHYGSRRMPSDAREAHLGLVRLAPELLRLKFWRVIHHVYIYIHIYIYIPIVSMYAIYGDMDPINIPQMLAYITYMDPILFCTYLQCEAPKI